MVKKLITLLSVSTSYTIWKYSTKDATLILNWWQYKKMAHAFGKTSKLFQWES